MPNLRNYYEILGVTEKSSAEDIKRAYRSLARRYHPDRNQGNKMAEEKFKDINEAYEVLSDPAKKAQYDNFNFPKKGVWGRGKGRTQPPRPGRYSNGNSDPFDGFVRTDRPQGNTSTAPRNGRGTATQPDTSRRVDDPNYRPGRAKYERTMRPSRDIEAKLTLPLSKAYRGGRERIRLEDGRSLEVDMPPAMFNGQKIRLRGQGLDGGDLYLKITVARHPFFEIQGKDVFCRIPITVVEAVLGGAIEVPTIDGLVKMTLPPGVRSGQRLRLANKGYPDKSGERGDQLVEIQIITPKHISDQERELYEKLQVIETFKPRQNLIESL